MSMTREEAIKSLKNIVEYWTYKPTEVEAAKMAIDALHPVSREQVEKVWRGEWIIPTIIGGRAYNIPHCSACNGVPCGTDEHTRFCAHCGAPMTDEAVQMVIERMEALHDNRT